MGLFQLGLLEDPWNLVGVTSWVTLKQHILSFNTISQLLRFHVSHKMTWPARFGLWVWHTWCRPSVSSWPYGFCVFVLSCYYKEKPSATSGFFRQKLIANNHLDGFCILVTTTFWTAGHKSLPLWKHVCVCVLPKALCLIYTHRNVFVSLGWMSQILSGDSGDSAHLRAASLLSSRRGGSFPRDEVIRLKWLDNWIENVLLGGRAECKTVAEPPALIKCKCWLPRIIYND